SLPNRQQIDGWVEHDNDAPVAHPRPGYRSRSTPGPIAVDRRRWFGRDPCNGRGIRPDRGSPRPAVLAPRPARSSTAQHDLTPPLRRYGRIGARGPSIYLGREPDAATSIPDGAADLISIISARARGGTYLHTAAGPNHGWMDPDDCMSTSSTALGILPVQPKGMGGMRSQLPCIRPNESDGTVRTQIDATRSRTDSRRWIPSARPVTTANRTGPVTSMDYATAGTRLGRRSLRRRARGSMAGGRAGRLGRRSLRPRHGDGLQDPRAQSSASLQLRGVLQSSSGVQ
ncbi:hypothetical protein THAOC_26288, partial [Thalassiosira oceanica]